MADHSEKVKHMDRVLRCNTDVETSCFLCYSRSESSDHLLAECRLTRGIRTRNFQLLDQALEVGSFDEDILFMR